jgi:hypothetical protein
MTTVTIDVDINLGDVCDEELIEEIESRGLLEATYEGRVRHLMESGQYRHAAHEALEEIEKQAGKEGSLTRYLCGGAA